MLRAIQTSALSNTIANLFDKSASETKHRTQPVLIEVKTPCNDQSTIDGVETLLVRRRRARRNRVMASANASRAAWV